MTTWLYLTAEGLADPSADWPSYLWSALGERQQLPLKHAAHVLGGRAVSLLLPMELCSWLRSEPWPGKRRPNAQALAFAVEDQLGAPLESVHLSIGAPDDAGRYPLLVIDRQRFADVLALLAELGIEVRSVYVDADWLPCDQPLAIWWAGRWILGGALPARLALRDEGLETIKPLLPDNLQWIDERENPLAVDQWLSTPMPTAIDLRHGEFAARANRLPWRHAGYGLLMLALLGWGASAARIAFIDREADRLNSANQQRFQALYPQHNGIVDLTQLKALHNPTAPTQSTRIGDLISLVQHVVGASQVEVQRIEWREDHGWTLQLRVNSFAELEQLRERGRQQGVPMTLDNASKDGDQVQATLTVETGA